jgi:hypothetical protein
MNHAPKRRVAAGIATAVLALSPVCLLPACGSGSPPPTSAGGSPGGAQSSAQSPSAVGYSACVRTHGVPNFPDPDPGSGAVPKGDAQHFGVGAAVLRAAQQACQSLLPADGSLDQQAEQCISGGDCPQAVVQQILAAQRSFAQCMRSHGVPKYPDPSIDSQGRPIFVFDISRDGFDPHEPQIANKEDECQRAHPAPMPRQINP